jgi:hypothetical protein
VKKFAVMTFVIVLCMFVGLSFLWLMNYGMRPFWRPFATISLAAEDICNRKTGQVVTCYREPGAHEGQDETRAMKACVAKYAAKGFARDCMPPKIPN